MIDHDINPSKYNPLTGSSYIKLPKELDDPRKGLINIKNHHTARITKDDNNFPKSLNFKNILKKILPEKVFLVMKIRKKIQSMYQNNVKKNMLIYY